MISKRIYLYIFFCHAKTNGIFTDGYEQDGAWRTTRVVPNNP